MNTNTDLALIPVNHEIHPVRGISNKGVKSYTDPQRDNLVRLSSPESKYNRVGSIYDRIGNEKDNKGIGENVDLYV
ncbi:MAG: hypothetical protein JXL81_12235 [Deltaproteobacteria bacterium]|nr:hypothetical protein [Deltaproteobacteria bacterium]